MNCINVSFDEVVGEIKPLNSVCCAPYSPNEGPEQPKIVNYFKEGNIPYCRLHDCCGAYGGSRFVDVPNIFRDFDADENDPESYDFYYSDEYITAIQNGGTEAYYRLGVTIEWGSKKYTTLPPKDFYKWARICEHIVMHYNEGWANGFHYNLKYWEIWNEPENPKVKYGSSMWNGTKEEFFELYSITSKHLKARFPDISVGGYGSCGFYTITRTSYPENFKGFVPYFTDFLEMVKKEGCPLDFFSWHIYTGDETELLRHAEYVRKTLDKYGFTNTESHLNEWNIHAEGRGFESKHTLEGASFNAAVLSMLQTTNYVDKAMYYCFSLHGMYNGFMNQNDGSIDPPWYSYVAFGKLYALKNAVSVNVTGERIYAAAAVNGENGAILVSNFKSEDEKTEIHIEGMKQMKKARVSLLAEGKNLTEEFSVTLCVPGDLVITLPLRTVALIELS